MGERLKLIGFWQESDAVPVPSASERSAADVYLGSKLDEIAVQFDRSWDEHVATQWQPRFKHFQNTQKRLAELDKKSRSETLTPDDFAEKVGLTCEKDGPDAGVPIARIAAETHPDNADLIFGLGALLLQQGDESGIDHLNHAVELDKDYRYGANERIFQYLNSNGRFDDARPYANFVEEEGEILQKAQLERSAIHGSDRFQIHDLDDEAVSAIAATVAEFKEITTAYLVNKVVAYKAEVLLRVLFIEPRPSRLGLNESDYSADRLIEKLVNELKDTDLHYFAVTNGDFAGLLPHLNSIDGAKVLSRR